MARTVEVLDEKSTPTVHLPELRAPMAGTRRGRGAGILVVVAGFVWTIL